MPRFDNLSAEELEQIKRFIEENGIDTIDGDARACRDALARCWQNYRHAWTTDSNDQR